MLDKMEARMSYQKTERILKKECDNTLGTGAFDVNYEAATFGRCCHEKKEEEGIA